MQPKLLGRKIMKILKIILLLCLLIVNTVFAQQMMTISGLIKSESGLLPNTRVALHVIDQQNNQYVEILGVTPVAGTFNLSTTVPLDNSYLSPLTSGSTVLPGFQDGFTVNPEGAYFARAITNLYVDTANNATYDGHDIDPLYLGIASVENLPGFFAIIYVDRDVTLSGAGAAVQLYTGWNIFTVRFNQQNTAIYTAEKVVNDAVLDMFLPRLE